MPSFMINNLDETIKNHLKTSALKHRCTIEDEIKRIISQAFLPSKKEKGLGTHLHQQIIALTLDGDLKLPVRSLPRSAPEFLENTE